MCMKLKQFIYNKSNERLAVQIEGLENKTPTGLVFIAHGMSGYKEHHLVRIPTEVCLNKGYLVVSYDARYSFGESDGTLDKGWLQTYIEDLKTVLNWTKRQTFYQEPFSLIGHSLGAGAAIDYAETNSEKVLKLISIAGFFSGSLLLKSYQENMPDLWAQWQKEGRIEKVCKENPSKTGFIPPSYILNTLPYDFVQKAGQITANTLLICGGLDKSSTPFNNQIFYDALQTPKKMVVLEECNHFFSKPIQQESLKMVLDSFM